MTPCRDGNKSDVTIKSNTCVCQILTMLTELDNYSNTINDLNSGIDDHVFKPFEMEMLLLKIENALNHIRSIREKIIKNASENSEIEFASEIDQEFMHKVKDIIFANISNPNFKIEMISERMIMSRSAFYMKFKALIGQSPIHFINQIRMEKAAELLRSKKYRINEIANMLGFDDCNYFSKTFKNFYGVNARNFK